MAQQTFSLAVNKILIGGTNANVAGAWLQEYVLANISSGNANPGTGTVIPAGFFYAIGGNNVVIEINQASGSTNSWQSFYAANTNGVVISDGQNVRANSAVAGQQIMQLFPIGSEEQAPGTFNR